MDFLVLSSNFGNAGNWEEGDADANGLVDVRDFLALSANYGSGSGGSGTRVLRGMVDRSIRRKKKKASRMRLTLEGQAVGELPPSVVADLVSRGVAIGPDRMIALAQLTTRPFRIRHHFSRRKSTKPERADSLLSPAAVAERLSVSARTVIRYIESGHLPAIPLPSAERTRWRIKPEDLQAFLDERYRPARVSKAKPKPVTRRTF